MAVLLCAGSPISHAFYHRVQGQAEKNTLQEMVGAPLLRRKPSLRKAPPVACNWALEMPRLPAPSPPPWPVSDCMGTPSVGTL